MKNQKRIAKHRSSSSRNGRQGIQRASGFKSPKGSRFFRAEPLLCVHLTVASSNLVKSSFLFWRRFHFELAVTDSSVKVFLAQNDPLCQNNLLEGHLLGREAYFVGTLDTWTWRYLLDRQEKKRLLSQTEFNAHIFGGARRERKRVRLKDQLRM